MAGTEAKNAGKKLVLRNNWDEIKKSVMLELLYTKFTQNPELTALLLNTGDAYLEEGNNWDDTFWGVCNGKGTNYLGRYLMKIRDILIYSNKLRIKDFHQEYLYKKTAALLLSGENQMKGNENE